eukprot:Gb_06574 [translate_table: standard]
MGQVSCLLDDLGYPSDVRSCAHTRLFPFSKEGSSQHLLSTFLEEMA